MAQLYIRFDCPNCDGVRNLSDKMYNILIRQKLPVYCPKCKSIMYNSGYRVAKVA